MKEVAGGNWCVDGYASINIPIDSDKNPLLANAYNVLQLMRD